MIITTYKRVTVNEITIENIHSKPSIGVDADFFTNINSQYVTTVRFLLKIPRWKSPEWKLNWVGILQGIPLPCPWNATCDVRNDARVDRLGITVAWVELFQEGWWGKRFSNLKYWMTNLESVRFNIFVVITMIISRPRQKVWCGFKRTTLVFNPRTPRGGVVSTPPPEVFSKCTLNGLS